MPNPAAQPLHDVRFPNESSGYRDARNALLAAEMELRRQTEAVAALRRALPSGGEPPEDYVFADAGPDDARVGRSVKLSELFGDKDTLVVYSFMYGPEDEAACPLCTSILDALDGTSVHVNQRISFVVVAKSPVERIRRYARERGWRRLRLYSSNTNRYNADYRGESPEGNQIPSLNVFVRRDGKVRHFYNSELLFAPWEPGQHPRHVDPIWPIWNLLDYTPDGRGTDWEPQRSYAA